MLKSVMSKFWIRGATWTKLVVSSPSSTKFLRVQCFGGYDRSASYGGYDRSAGYDRLGSNDRAGGYDRNRTSGFGGRYQERPSYRPKISLDNLPPVVKKPYAEDPSVASRPQEEIDKYLAENQVTLNGQNVPRPILQFSESPFPEQVKNLLSQFSSPSVIQAVSWPVALSGRDIVSIAKTGSGKTLGFLLPAIMHIMNQPPRAPGDGPIALVLLPTRELAQQVEKVAQEYCRQMKLPVAVCFGGSPRISQEHVLRAGVDICVGTPGRLNDFVESGILDTRRCSFLVLDEADRMLDMGFEPQIRKIVNQIRPDRQTLMFSATWPNEIRSLASDFLKDPVFLNVGSLELSANPNIKQHVEVVEDSNKMERLSQLMDEITQEKEHKTLIFVNTKRMAETVARQLQRDRRLPVVTLHGDKTQSERDFVMNEYRLGRKQILVATDVAARGLDVSDIKYVINYDYPNDADDYVHRIGRTARGNRTGTSYTFFTGGDSTGSGKVKNLISILEEAKQDVPFELKELEGHGGSSRASYGRRNDQRGGYRQSENYGY